MKKKTKRQGRGYARQRQERNGEAAHGGVRAQDEVALKQMGEVEVPAGRGGIFAYGGTTPVGNGPYRGKQQAW